MGLVSGTITLSVALQDYVSSGYVNPQTFLAQLQSPGIPGASIAYTSGTGALQVDSLYFKPIALVASTPQTFDLTSLTGLGGESLNFARVRELILFNADGTAGHDVGLYQGASLGWSILPTSSNPLYARADGGLARASDPNSTGSGGGNVTSSGGGTGKNIVLDPGSHNVTVYLLIAGGSAA